MQYDDGFITNVELIFNTYVPDYRYGSCDELLDAATLEADAEQS